MERFDGRSENELRHVKITRHYLKNPAGSVLIELGDTKVICSASIIQQVPKFLKGTGTGWLSAEYSLLPGSTQTRVARESVRGRISGRTQEIQRLIGRSLRSIMDLKALGEKNIIIDCDVIQADGGTRTAAITGAFIALVDAMESIYDPHCIFPVKDFLAATSVGVINKDDVILDLCYAEDSHAVVDMNVVMTGNGEFVEIQGTGEEHPFSRQQLNALLEKAENGINKLISYQKNILGNRLGWRIGREP
ncbi:ribonuclease PH [Pectinatus cerevisiiphilus]|uniref:Ribonuclease PH n=1 Tax=Pectinatus cerevisiiphilus TaxID=86956 RepID=A0A4R3K9T1_9FIRM|nr:ribonuclease PH [Pectinatus cerevisiiphilus]TCS79708.1 ribonuclease PH [Pectinatus cerevisiiphilus]